MNHHADDAPTTRGSGDGMPGRGTRRRRLTAGQRRDDILDAAANLYSEGRSGDYTIDDVAKKAGVSRATFYRLFNGLEDLRMAIIGRIAGAFQKRMFSGFGSDNQWEELLVGIREFLRISDAVRSEVLALLDSHGRGAIAEGMRSAIASEIARRVDPVEETPLGRAALRAWVAAAEHEVREWLQARALDKSAAEPRDIVAERMALMLPAIAGAFAEGRDDVFLAEVIRVLEVGRADHGQDGSGTE
ncbi:TetR/AcrR family transcriptional regulator [uncultured Corynebacterium sp.]|uniref:TetR/AcrR family transcriptional regulator n=1 Tax=uncultured Corynebacterium sp. TaxID=159447 RepID=UPI0025F2EA65|nr:TetR/AcrR family transcriptional regulator [uncultured Corynebacterium sp.]